MQNVFFGSADVKPSLWPERVLMICDWGRNIYSCLDCRSVELPVLRMDSNRNFLVEWAIEALSFEEWLDAWITGKSLCAFDWENGIKVPVSSVKKYC